MAGVKRKLEASQEPAATSETGAADTAETSQPAPESPNRGRGSRGTRNARSGRVSRGGRGRGRGSSIGATAEPSTSAQPTSSTQPATTASSNEPETPRLKRTRRSFAIEETPRTTRQSARLKARANSSSSLETPNFQDAIEEAQPEESAVANADVPSGRTRNKTAAKLADSNTAAQNATTADPETQSSASFLPPNTASETAEPSTSLQTRDTPSQSTEPEPSAPAGNLTSNEDQHQNPAEEASTTPQTGTARELRNTPSRSASRKRRAAKMEEDEDIDDSYAPNSASKKPKLEDDEVDRALQQQLQDGTEQAHTSVTPVRESTEPKDQDESRQITEETTASALEDDNGSASNGRGRGGRGSAGRGRGGGGGRGRGGATRGRGGARGGKRGGGRGRGRGRGRGGRGGGRGSKQAEEESDYEEFEERSPSPSPATQKLRERQRELDKAFKKVAAAQRLALAVLAAQSQRRLARDKNAHINAPEYEQVQGELKERLQKKKEQIRRHYELKVEEENILYAANKDLLERQFRVSQLSSCPFLSSTNIMTTGFGPTYSRRTSPCRPRRLYGVRGGIPPSGGRRPHGARRVGRRSRLLSPGGEEVQERVQLVVREGPCGRRGVRARRLRLGGLRAARQARGRHQSPDEGDQQPRGAAVPVCGPPQLGNHRHVDRGDGACRRPLRQQPGPPGVEETAMAQLRGEAACPGHVRPGRCGDGRTEPRSTGTDAQAASVGSASNPATARGACSGADGPPLVPVAAARSPDAATEKTPAGLDPAHQ